MNDSAEEEGRPPLPVLVGDQGPKPDRRGLASLWVAAAGLVLPLALIVYIIASRGPRGARAPGEGALTVGLLVVASFLAEATALGIGVWAWRSREGKAGVAGAAFTLLFWIGLYMIGLAARR